MSAPAVRHLFAIAATAMLLGAAGESLAQPTTVPAGLSPGDKYRLAFVTSMARNATSSNIADYNAFVTAVANSVPELLALGTTWTAIGSTATVDARDNTNTNPGTAEGVPVYLLDGTLLVTDNADLWDGDIGAMLNVDEGGVSSTGEEVWTGTSNPDGVGEAEVLGARPFVTCGYSLATDIDWIRSILDHPESPYPLYALSGELTVPSVPVPAFPVFWRVVLTGALLAASWWRVRQI